MSLVYGHIFSFLVQLIVSCRLMHFQTGNPNGGCSRDDSPCMAMYNRSTLILGGLLTSFSLEIIANAAVISNLTNVSSTSTRAT